MFLCLNKRGRACEGLLEAAAVLVSGMAAACACKLSCILLAEVLVGPDLFVSCVLASMADSDLGRILAPLPLELLPCAVVAFRESSAADFDAVLRSLLAAGRFGHFPDPWVTL